MEIAEQAIAPVEHPFIAQEWSRYSDEDHEVWSLLYARRMEQLERTASQVFLDGAKLIGLAPDLVPDLGRVNQRLAHLTGWAAVAVADWFSMPAMIPTPMQAAPAWANSSRRVNESLMVAVPSEKCSRRTCAGNQFVMRQAGRECRSFSRPLSRSMARMPPYYHDFVIAHRPIGICQA